MKPLSYLFPLVAVASHAIAAPPAADREAILSMAGTHAVSFHFQETVSLAESYQVKPESYDETATELIIVVEDEPERIALQHLLMVSDSDGNPSVIKHWAQIWTWQDTSLLDYAGSDGDLLWKKIELTSEQAAGTWSQLVTQVDDTPRYEGYGSWQHDRGESRWVSEPSRRPLPRREYSQRDDYDYLVVTNSVSLTPTGWVHFQDNRKVVDREDAPAVTLCQENGINTYTRTESDFTADALAWWEEHGAFWDGVRDFWVEAGEAAPHSFTYTTFENGESLKRLFARLEQEPPSPEQTAQILAPYAIAE